MSQIIVKLRKRFSKKPNSKCMKECGHNVRLPRLPSFFYFQNQGGGKPKSLIGVWLPVPIRIIGFLADDRCQDRSIINDHSPTPFYTFFLCFGSTKRSFLLRTDRPLCHFRPLVVFTKILLRRLLFRKKGEKLFGEMGPSSSIKHLVKSPTKLNLT